MDEYRRYIVAWKLFTSISTDDEKQTLDLAITASGIDTPKVRRRPLLYRPPVPVHNPTTTLIQLARDFRIGFKVP